MADLPNSSNFFATISAKLEMTVEDMAAIFCDAGWRVRKCSWTEYEVISEFAELVIEVDDDDFLLHGPVAEVMANYPRIVEPLKAEGLAGSFECYDEDDSLFHAGRF